MTLVTRVFLADAVWTIPSGVTALELIALQGGGGNGTKVGSTTGPAAGGASGGFIAITAAPVVAGQQLTIQVGGQGIGGIAAATRVTSGASYAEAAGGDNAVGSNAPAPGGTSTSQWTLGGGLYERVGTQGQAGANTRGGSGGGGAPGPSGAGGWGGRSGLTNSGYGGGGGAANGGGNGEGGNSAEARGGHGGDSPAGAIGGRGATLTTAAKAGTNGSGGGGGANAANLRSGADGSFQPLWTDTITGTMAGPGAGGGGRCINDTVARGGDGGFGAGGGGGSDVANSGRGGPGYVVIQYDVADAAAQVQPGSGDHGHVAAAPLVNSRGEVSPDPATIRHSATAPKVLTSSAVAPAVSSHALQSSGALVRLPALIEVKPGLQGHAAVAPRVAARSAVKPVRSLLDHGSTSPTIGRLSVLAPASAVHALRSAQVPRRATVQRPVGASHRPDAATGSRLPVGTAARPDRPKATRPSQTSGRRL